MFTLASFFRQRCIQVFAIATFTVAAFGTAHADPIIVSGSATLGNGAFFGPTINFNISGQNFQAFNIEDPGGPDHFGHFGISPCSRSVAPLNGGPCTSANLGYSGNGSELDGMFTVNGQTFVSDVINTLNFQITSPTFVIPPELLNEPSLLITAPFIFTGVAGGACCQAVDLAGQGTVTLLLTRQTVGGFTGLFLDNVHYVFGETVPGVTFQTEVPEPATMVLLLSGLAGTVVRLGGRTLHRVPLDHGGQRRHFGGNYAVGLGVFLTMVASVAGAAQQQSCRRGNYRAGFQYSNLEEVSMFREYA